MNAKKELLEHIGDREVKYVRAILEHSYDNKETIEGTLDEVLPKLDFDYDNGYGGQYMKGTIWYSDGTWSDRGEYDGSEWWEHLECPSLPNAEMCRPEGEKKTMKTHTTPPPEGLAPASGSDLHRPTLLAVRLRLIAMYESCDALAKKCEAEEGGQDMANNVREQSFGLRKARMMLGSMLDEQQGHAPASAHVAGVSDMPATTQAAMSNMIVCAMDAIERGDFDDQNSELSKPSSSNQPIL